MSPEEEPVWDGWMDGFFLLLTVPSELAAAVGSTLSLIFFSAGSPLLVTLVVPPVSHCLRPLPSVPRPLV